MTRTSESVSVHTRPTARRAQVDRRALQWTTPEKVWVVALVAVVAIQGAWHLGHASLWNDEAATWAISGHSFRGLFHVIQSSGGDRGAALYYFVMFVWIHLFGSSEVALRALSLVAASLTMIPFHACARRLVAPTAAWAAGAVLATSAFYLEHARDARTYSLAVLLVVLAVWTFLRALESASPQDWFLFSVFAVLAIYVHWFSALVIVALFVALLATRPEGEIRRRATTSAVVLGAATLPLCVLVVTGANSGVDWIAPLNVAELRATATQFAGTGDVALQLVIAMLLVTGLVASWASRRTECPSPIVVTWFSVPIVVTILVSIVKPVLVPRYLIIALPAYALAIGAGLSTFGRRRVIPVALLTLTFVACCYADIWHTGAAGENWRAIAASVDARAHPDDAIVVYPATAVSSFSYYARQDATLRARSGPTWPPSRWDAPFTRAIANSSVARQRDILGAPVVWLVVRQPRGDTISASVKAAPALRALRRQLGARFATMTVIGPWHTSKIVSVVRYSNPRP